MIKLRAMGLPEEIEKLSKTLNASEQIEVLYESDFYSNRGKSKLERKYYDVEIKENQEKKIGTIVDTSKTNGFINAESIGEGTRKKDRKEFELLQSMKYYPIVRRGKKYFILMWSDILNLAEKAGLFEE